MLLLKELTVLSCSAFGHTLALVVIIEVNIGFAWPVSGIAELVRYYFEIRGRHLLPIWPAIEVVRGSCFSFVRLICGVAAVNLRIIYRELILQVRLHDLLLTKRAVYHTAWVKANAKSLSRVEGRLGSICAFYLVLKLVTDHLEITAGVLGILSCVLVTVEIEVTRSDIGKVLHAFWLLGWNLPLSVVVVVLWENVLLRLQIQYLGLVLFDRLRRIRLVKGVIYFPIRRHEFVYNRQVLLRVMFFPRWSLFA